MLLYWLVRIINWLCDNLHDRLDQILISEAFRLFSFQCFPLQCFGRFPFSVSSLSLSTFAFIFFQNPLLLWSQCNSFVQFYTRFVTSSSLTALEKLHTLYFDINRDASYRTFRTSLLLVSLPSYRPDIYLSSLPHLPHSPVIGSLFSLVS